jgi:hypothetical protein
MGVFIGVNIHWSIWIHILIGRKIAILLVGGRNLKRVVELIWVLLVTCGWDWYVTSWNWFHIWTLYDISAWVLKIRRHVWLEFFFLGLFLELFFFRLNWFPRFLFIYEQLFRDFFSILYLRLVFFDLYFSMKKIKFSLPLFLFELNIFYLYISQLFFRLVFFIVPNIFEGFIFIFIHKLYFLFRCF